MGKERVEKFNLVEYSFDQLNLGKIEPGSGSERAMRDAIDLGEKREEAFISCFQSDNFDGVNYTGVNYERDIRIFDEIKKIREDKLMENKDNLDYIEVYNKTTDWLGKGFLECGITSGAKLRCLIGKFGREDKEPEDRSNRTVLV